MMDWWRYIFELGSLLALFSCLLFMFNENLRHPRLYGHKISIIYVWAEPTALLLCYGFYYVLESWAAYRAPVFYYPDSAIGLQWLALNVEPFILFIGDLLDKDLRPYPNGYACYEFVHKITGGKPTIPLAIPAMEAAMTYGSLRTARFLIGAGRATASMFHAWWVALIAALICLTTILILDPAVSTSSVDCGQTQSYGGAGVWRWIEDETGWFGVPTWNFALWFAAPITGAAIAYWSVWCWARVFKNWPRTANSELWAVECEDCDGPASRFGKFMVFCIFALGFSVILIVLSAHDSFAGMVTDYEHLAALKRALILGLAASVLASTIIWSGSWHRDREVPWALVLPLLFFLWWPIVWYLANGILTETPSKALEVVYKDMGITAEPLAHMAYGVGAGILLALSGSFLVFSPYLDHVKKFARLIRNINDFIRVHYFSHTSMHVFLGAGIPYALATAGNREPTGNIGVDAVQLGQLLATAALFHVFMILLNDWKDWKVDETQPRRKDRRVIAKKIGRNGVLICALLPVPLAALLNYNAGGSWLLLAIVYGGMTVYNLIGKNEHPSPIITDFIQGVSWGALALYAVELVSNSGVGDLPLLGYVLAISGVLYIMLVNGFHASIRDLPNDFKHGKWTTARSMGSEPKDDGETATIPFKLRILASSYYIAHVMTVALLYAYVNDNIVDLISNGWIYIIIAILIWNSRLMSKVLDPFTRDRDPLLSQHALALMLGPIVVLIPSFEPATQMATIVFFFLPFWFLDPTMSNLTNVLTGKPVVANRHRGKGH